MQNFNYSIFVINLLILEIFYKKIYNWEFIKTVLKENLVEIHFLKYLQILNKIVIESGIFLDLLSLIV